MMIKRSAKIYLLSLSFLLGACASTDPANKVWPMDKRVQAQIDLGMNYLQRDQLDVARDNFEKALSLNDKSAAAYHGLGLVEAKSLNSGLARQYLKRAVELNPSNLNANNDYAVILCETQSARHGIELLQGMPQAETSLGSQLALGRCFEQNHELGRAEGAYKAVLAMQPGTRQALLSMAHLKYQADNYLSARGFLQRYFATNTVSSDALLLAAKVENNLSNAEQRNLYTKQLWARYPRSKHATEARELFKR